LDKKRACQTGTSWEKGMISTSDTRREYDIENDKEQKTTTFERLHYELHLEMLSEFPHSL
jgi:hypothetical protein